jgi:hypothetical protein
MKTPTLANSPTALRRADRVPVVRATKIPFALAMLAVSIVLPEELSFYIFGLRLTPTRLLLIVIAPFLVIRLTQLVGAGRYHFVLPDLFVVLSGFWIICASANLTGLADALNHAGPIALEFCIGYMATRVLLVEHGHALKFVSLLCSMLALVGLLAATDSLAGYFVIHDLAGALTGYHKWWQVDYRFGLLRATGPFEHPIFLGMLCGIGLVIASYVDIGPRKFAIIGCACGAIFAFSSAPIQSIMISIGLMTYNRVLSGFSSRWLFLIGVFAVTLAAIAVSGHSIIGFVISNLIYDPASGYYREWTWTMVSAAVEQSPWFGLGFGPYPDYLEINHSIDSLWLVLALNFGLPGAIFVALSLITAIALPVSSNQLDLLPMEKRLGIVLGISLVVMIFMGFTVDFWGSTWIASGVLMGVKAHLGALGCIGRRPA